MDKLPKIRYREIMDRIIAHIRLLRPLNLTIGAFSVVIGVAIAGELRQTATVIIATLLVVCFNAAANALNDYFDYEIDKINRPNRPLVTGLVKRDAAKWLGIILFIMGTGLAFKLNLGARFLALGAALPLMVFYTPVLKGQPLIGNIAVALILGLTFLFAGAAVGNPGPLMVPAVLAFGLTLVRELLKDIADVEGDAKSNLHTLPLLVGEGSATITAINLAFLVAVGTMLPFIFNYYNGWYLLVAGIGVFLPLGYIIFALVHKPDPKTAAFSAKLLKIATLMGVIAIYVG